MDGPQVAQIRSRLGKSQAEMAHLLGISCKAMQSFEQGWRRVPVHVERQLLFLLCLEQRPVQGSEPCWEARNCPPGIREKCVAWELQAGHLCWFVTGTMCEGRPRSSWQEKMELCQQCRVFSSVVPTSDEEGPIKYGQGRCRDLG